MKTDYDYIFIVLVYRNMSDLIEMIESAYANVKDFKIIIVNSFFDEISRLKAEQIAMRYACDFLNVENKGYSYGNNTGIEYALGKYTYKYLIISNPDIVIKKFRGFDSGEEAVIIAPQIVAASGKHQNPMVIKENRLSERFIYQGYKKNNNLRILIGMALNKLSNKIHFQNKDRYKIFCAHGSFLLISAAAIRALGPRPYDENMFLFGEEAVLAYKAKECSVKTYYDRSISVFHKEDGSMKLSNLSLNAEIRKANIYFYETYILRKRL